MIDVKRIWKQGLAFGLSLLVIGCTVNRNDGDGGGGSDSPGYDYTELEPNDAFEQAQFLTVLPEWSERTLGGDWWKVSEKDFYWYFLDPPAGVFQLNFNVVMTCPTNVHPGFAVFQSVYNSMGDLIDYQLLGTYQGYQGNLVALDIPIPYDPFYNNDLIIMTKCQGFGTDIEYTLDFWND